MFTLWLGLLWPSVHSHTLRYESQKPVIFPKHSSWLTPAAKHIHEYAGHTPLPNGCDTSRARSAPVSTLHSAFQPLASNDSMLNTNSSRTASVALPEKHMHTPFYRLRIRSKQFFSRLTAEDLRLFKDVLQFLLLPVIEAWFCASWTFHRGSRISMNHSPCN